MKHCKTSVSLGPEARARLARLGNRRLNRFIDRFFFQVAAGLPKSTGATITYQKFMPGYFKITTVHFTERNQHRLRNLRSTTCASTSMYITRMLNFIYNRVKNRRIARRENRKNQTRITTWVTGETNMVSQLDMVNQDPVEIRTHLRPKPPDLGEEAN